MSEIISSSPNPVTLRLATSSDVPQIATLYATVFSATFGHSIPASDLATYLSTIYSPSPPSGSMVDDISNPNITIVVACPLGKEEQVVGFLQLNESTSEKCVEGKESPVKLQRLYVSGEWSGQGVGRLLMDRMVEVAMGKGKKTLWLGVVSYGRFVFEVGGEC
jgi:ribosomal protein S18 acetylase RimI-like enzyme